MLTEDRCWGLAKIQVYAPGQGDSRLVDRGFASYDVMQRMLLPNGMHAGTIQKYQGHPTLQFLPEVGLVCRPFVNIQHTKKTDYTFHDADLWEERRPISGADRKSRLKMLDGRPNVGEWFATSKFSLDPDPSVAFSFIFQETPDGHDSEVQPPYVRLELGGDPWTYALEWSKRFGGRLLINMGGVEHWVSDLPSFLSVGNMDLGECLLVLRVHRGSLMISTDFGQQYQGFTFPGWDYENPTTVLRGGKFTVRGQGNPILWGLHQIQYRKGYWRSFQRSAWISRMFASPFIWGRYNTVTGGVAFTDRSAPGLSQYDVTLTPGSRSGVPFRFYRSPEVYSVGFEVSATRIDPLLVYDEPFGTAGKDLLAVDVTKPWELDGATCNFRARRDATERFDFSRGRWVKCRVWLGEFANNGVDTTWANVHTGYLETLGPVSEDFNESDIVGKIANATERAKRQKWDSFTVPLGARTLNQCLDVVLDKMGGQPTDRSWHVWGDFIIVPFGSPENPCEWPREGDPLWKTMTDFTRRYRLEVFTDDAGIWRTLPRDYVNPVVNWQWEWNPETGPAAALIQRMEYHLTSTESATAVVVRAKDKWGQDLYAFAIDSIAETVPWSVRFTPWREVETEVIEGTADLAMTILCCQSLFRDLAPLKVEGEIQTIGNLAVSRRDRGQLLDTTLGTLNSDDFVVYAIKHHWEGDITEAETTVTLRRLEE